MGKDTYKELIKVILVSVISIFFSITLTRRTILDNKLDKSEFKEFKVEHMEKHKSDALIEKEFRTWLKKEIEGIRDDVRAMKNN